MRHSATIFFKDQKKFHKNTRKIMNFEQKVNFLGQMIYMQDLQLIETWQKSVLSKYIVHCTAFSLAVLLKQIISCWIGWRLSGKLELFTGNSWRFLNLNIYFKFCLTFVKSMLNFIHFPKRNDLDSWCISGINGSEKRG